MGKGRDALGCGQGREAVGYVSVAGVLRVTRVRAAELVAKEQLHDGRHLEAHLKKDQLGAGKLDVASHLDKRALGQLGVGGGDHARRPNA